MGGYRGPGKSHSSEQFRMSPEETIHCNVDDLLSILNIFTVLNVPFFFKIHITNKVYFQKYYNVKKNNVGSRSSEH